MLNLLSAAIFFAALAGPLVLEGRPQAASDFSVGCNMTGAPVAEERSARPEYPDPVQKSADKHHDASGRVIFPGPSQNSFKNPMAFANHAIVSRDKPVSFVPNVPLTERGPSCAEGSTFCEEADQYPREYILSLMRNDKKMFKDFMGDDIATMLNISQRIDASDESPLCPSLEQVVYPKTAQNKDDKWLYIVNLENEFVQGIRVEKCIKEAPCALSENLPIGYKTTCRQKYIYRKLVSLNEEGRALTDSFRIPSCCACHFRATSVASRFGTMNAMSPVRTRIGLAQQAAPSKSTTPAPTNKRQPKST